jgi:hypothetical protein
VEAKTACYFYNKGVTLAVNSVDNLLKTPWYAVKAAAFVECVTPAVI